MLNSSRSTSEGRLWVRDGRHDRVLAVERRSNHPDSDRLSFYAPDFSLKDSSPWFVGQRVEWSTEPKSPLPQCLGQHELHKDEFFAGHADILSRIEKSQLLKVVPVVAWELEFAAPLSHSMFETEKPLDPHLIGYGMDVMESGVAGWTPEILFSVDEGVLTTMALAGTAPADAPALLENPKERHEHQAVIDMLVETLTPWGAVEVGVTEERELGPIKHLYSPVRVRLKREPEFERLVHDLHPTPALGGSPKSEALAWLERSSAHRMRRRFGAPFGYIEPGRMLCLVAIRNLQWEKKLAWLMGGCGVVRGSVAEKEWSELQLKRQATLRALGLPL